MQVSFRVSPTAPNPAETTYWIDTTDNNYKGTIKYYNANTKKWEIVNDSTNSQQNEAIKELSTALQAIQATVSTLQRDKVDKVSGKTLSTNDYTTDEKNKSSVVQSFQLALLHKQTRLTLLIT